MGSTYRYCWCCGHDHVSTTAAAKPLCHECKEKGCDDREPVCDRDSR